MKIVRIQREEIAYPSKCACCMAPSTCTLERRKVDLQRVGLSVLAAAAGARSFAARLQQSRALQVPYCKECRDHVRWARLGGFFGFAVSIGVYALLGGFVGMLIAGFMDTADTPWLVAHPDSGPYVVMGSFALAGIALAISNLRFRPTGPLGRNHARENDAVLILRFSSNWIELRCDNDPFAVELNRLNPGTAHSPAR